MSAASELPGFAGAVVTSVTAWTYGVSLGFNDEPRGITLEGAVEVRTGGEAQMYIAGDGPDLAKRLLDLMGRIVLTSHRSPDKRVTLTFAEAVIVLSPDPSGYENYQINFPDGTVLVG